MLTKLSIAHHKIKENAFSNIFIDILFSRLLTQQMWITVNRLRTKEDKLPFSVCRKQTVVFAFSIYVCIKQTEVAASVSFVFRIYIDIDVCVCICISIYIYMYMLLF